MVSRTQRDCIVLLAVFYLLRCVVLYLLQGAISQDMHGWEVVAAALMKGENPYVVTPYLNWPPFWMWCLFGVSKVCSSFQIPFTLGVRILLISAESVLVIILYLGLLRVVGDRRAFFTVFFGAVCNPVSIVLVCQHGNFDIFVALALTSAILAISGKESGDSSRAALLIGIGGLIKTIPVLAFPLAMTGFVQASPRERLSRAALVLFPMSIGLLSLYSLAPGDVVTKVLGYRSLPGWFAVSGVLDATLPASVARNISLVIFLVIGASVGTILLRKIAFRGRLPLSIGSSVVLCIMLTVVIFGPGYGLQYIHWFYGPAVLAYGVNPRLRASLLVMYGVATVTYLPLYAFSPVLGGWSSLQTIAFDRLQSALFLGPLAVSFSWVLTSALMEVMAEDSLEGSSAKRNERRRRPLPERTLPQRMEFQDISNTSSSSERGAIDQPSVKLTVAAIAP